jgi:hypothetical protein
VWFDLQEWSHSLRGEEKEELLCCWSAKEGELSYCLKAEAKGALFHCFLQVGV